MGVCQAGRAAERTREGGFLRPFPAAASRLLASGLIAVLAACDTDATGPLAPGPAPATAPLAAVTGAGTGVVTTQIDGAKCLTSRAPAGATALA
jgi:hypothetical protein